MTSLNTQDPIRLVQITDTHLYGKPSGTLLKMNTQDSFDEVIELVSANEQDIDLILATGDIAQDASELAYQRFIDAMEKLATPFRWIPGNHDKAAVMRQLANEHLANERLLRINNWGIVLLDTSVDAQVHGWLAPTELLFLQESLEQLQADAAIDHIVVCLHHNPSRGNAGWMKDIGLHNRQDFLAIIADFEKVRCVVYGHIHQELDYQQGGVRFLCTPSTCIQFKPHVTNFALDRMNPGYRSLRLFANGDIESEVHRVEGLTFEADFSSAGY